jgi:hypothetical protein
MAEYRRKTLRSFYCEEDLWKAFDERAKARDATIDQVLNDALRQVLEGGAPAAPPAADIGATQSRPAFDASVGAAAPTLEERPTLERMPAVGAKPTPPPAPKRPTPPPAPAVRPAAAPAAPPVTPPSPAAMPTLYLHYGGRVHLVQSERYVIGRGSQGTDLMIRDANISRKHAVVLWHEGAYYIQDLGSTNGVEFGGHRVETKQIEEGDQFTICDHELTFSYRG